MMDLDLPKAAAVLVDEADAKLLPDLLKALQPVIDAANELRGTLARVNAILDGITGKAQP